jgi:hypothetical protein
MKTLILLSILSIAAECSFSQNTIFKGKILLEDSFTVNDGFVVFPIKRDTVYIGKSGIVSIDLSQENNRVFFFQWMDWKSKVYRFSTEKSQSKVFDVNIPDQKFYKNFHAQKICPICSKAGAVIPIIYGFPSEKDFHEADDGKIYLGGCDIHEYQPKYHCKDDKFSF